MADLIIAKYIRLSLDDGHTDSMSLGHQRLLLDQYIADSDLDGPVREFVDNGFSGLNFERPAVQELLELVKDGRVGCILVKDFSRFGRNAIETGYFIERVFPLYRVRFISVSDHFDSAQHDGDTGGMEVAFKFLMSEYYSRDLSKKISSAKQEKARRGEAVRKNCAFGYKLDDNRKMVIDPEAAETVRIIFEMYAASKSISKIEKRLYEENRPAPAAWKKYRCRTAETEAFRCVWQKSVILNILQDEQYLGTYTALRTKTKEIGNPNRAPKAKEDWIRIPGHHPEIIPRELFDAVQENLRTKGEPLRGRKMGTSQRYPVSASPLKGKAFCGVCGHSLRLSNTKNAAFHCWFTRSAPDIACHKLRIPSGELEDAVRETVVRQSKIVLNLDQDNMRSYRSKRQLDSERNLQDLQNEKQRLYESLVLGNIQPEEYKEQKKTLDAALDRQRDVHEVICEQEAKSTPSATAIKAAREALQSDELGQELADLLIDKVRVYPNNRIEIQWKVLGFGCIDAADADGLCVAN